MSEEYKGKKVMSPKNILIILCLSIAASLAYNFGVSESKGTVHLLSMTQENRPLVLVSLCCYLLSLVLTLFSCDCPDAARLGLERQIASCYNNLQHYRNLKIIGWGLFKYGQKY